MDKIANLTYVFAHQLNYAAIDLSEACCTCVKRDMGHQRGCQGVLRARQYFQFVKKARRLLDKMKAETGA